MRRFRFHADALAEFEAEVEYYLEISPEAASRFVDAFEAAVAFVRESPQAAVRVEDDVRRWNFHRFPHAVIFRVVDDVVVILAVMHGRREPGYWRSRLRG